LGDVVQEELNICSDTGVLNTERGWGLKLWEMWCRRAAGVLQPGGAAHPADRNFVGARGRVERGRNPAPSIAPAPL
jgi:hypothetical protein